MQQGMLSSLLLLSSLVFGSVSAMEMSPASVDKWLHDPQIQGKTSELLQYVVQDKVDRLNFTIERLALPQQEVVRFTLLQKLEQQSLALTPKMAIFVEQQLARPNTYSVTQDGDGYQLVIPAFNYQAAAHRLLKSWKQDQQVMTFVLAAERKELELSTWLSGSAYLVQTRERMFIRELDSLSQEAITHLSEQLTQATITSWLPSTQVLVRLAQVSEDPDIYKLLWQKKADKHSAQELVRLSGTRDEFSLQQMLQAATNPSLKEQAISLLTSIEPQPVSVTEYLESQKVRSPVESSSSITKNDVEKNHSWFESLLNDKENQVRVNLTE